MLNPDADPLADQLLGPDEDGSYGYRCEWCRRVASHYRSSDYALEALHQHRQRDHLRQLRQQG